MVYACLDCGDLEHEFAAIHSILGDPRDSFAAPDVFGDNLFYERGYFLSEFQVRSIGELTGLFMIYGFGFAAMLSGPGGDARFGSRKHFESGRLASSPAW